MLTAPLMPDPVAHYDRDGFQFPLDALTFDEAAALADEVLALDASGLAAHPVPWRQKTYLLLPSLDELVRDPRVTDHVAALLGDDLLVLSADLFVKRPRSTARITWHQDVNYWDLEPWDMLTAWVAFTPASVDNGCMRYLAGRHHSRMAHVERPSAANMLSLGQELEVAVDDAAAACVELQPGQLSLHHALTPHSSGPNLTDVHRVGFAIRYAATRVRQQSGPPITARLARGADAFGHFMVEDGPDAALSPTARAAHRAALAPHAATGFSTV